MLKKLMGTSSMEKKNQKTIQLENIEKKIQNRKKRIKYFFGKKIKDEKNNKKNEKNKNKKIFFKSEENKKTQLKQKKGVIF
jgi:hypothetical protein